MWNRMIVRSSAEHVDDVYAAFALYCPPNVLPPLSSTVQSYVLHRVFLAKPTVPQIAQFF
jgi:hypothetical protein